MEFKFAAGQMVSYKPMGQRTSTFTVVRQMPEEPRGYSDLRYRIKSTSENFERVVLEGELQEPSATTSSSEVELVFPKG